MDRPDYGLLAQKVWDLCHDVPSEVIRSIVCALAEGVEHDELRSRLGLEASLSARLQYLLGMGFDDREIISALYTGLLFQQESERRTSTFVCSGPTENLMVRSTEQVMLDLIDEAGKDLLLASYAAYNVPSLMEALQKAIDRGVTVRFVLETKEDSLEKLTRSATEAFADLRGAKFYHWPKDKRPSDASAVMHAKCVVSEKSFLISSANLTGSAVNSNMELGILHHDEEKAQELLRHFNKLIETGVLERL